ncbi:MAG TPA: MaoC/PaaZ C-terminal domain-containing protein [Advenella sp.]|nr:MaoC/PaaZ C-terminal domain-containing protein [Advenella sp.]
MQNDPTILGMGFYWQDLEVGQKFVTFKRTITETDIINFISCTGMLETIFIDKTFNAGAISGRPVPGALTYGIIEGILMQSMVQGTGLALLEVHKKMLAPVIAGDTVHADVLVTGIKPTSKHNRAVVDTHIDIRNQDDVIVISYDVKRMLAGRPQ